MKSLVKLTIAVLTIGILTGCAGPNQRVNNTNLFCTIAGGLVGGTLTAATVDSSAAIVGGATVGAALSLLLCPHDAVAEPVATAVIACPDEVPAGALTDTQGCAFDSDGDGVVDGIDLCMNTPTDVSVDRVGCALDGDKDAVPNYLDLCLATPLGTIVDPHGCPLPGQNLLSLTSVNFDTDKAELTPSAKDILEQAVRLFKEANYVIEVRVEGYTDSRGSDEYNMILSQKRSQSVVDYLVSRGVNGRHLVAIGMGESFPVATNDTAAGRAANRRVDFVVK